MENNDFISMSKLRNLYDFSKGKIKCDEENNLPEIIDNNQIKIEIFIPSRKNSSDCLILPLVYTANDLISSDFLGENENESENKY